MRQPIDHAWMHMTGRARAALQLSLFLEPCSHSANSINFRRTGASALFKIA